MNSEIFEESVDEAKRKLCSYQKITALTPIPEKDRIELASILGYKVVVKRGEFSVGDLCAFHEVDSYVDVRKPPYDFLAKRAKTLPDGTQRVRISTMKLGAAYSQGLAIPIHECPQLANVKPKEGLEITDLMGVVKFEAGGRIAQPPRKQTAFRKFLKFVMRWLPYDARVWIGSKFKSTKNL